MTINSVICSGFGKNAYICIVMTVSGRQVKLKYHFKTIKNMNNILKVAAMSAMLIFATGMSLNAQENGNRDDNGKIVRGPYETNRLGDNIWIGVAGGINVFENSFTDIGGVTPALDINIGKWFTPSVGARIGYQGLTASTWSNAQYPYYKEMGNDGKYKNVFNTAYIHGDVLWNISNAFSGYKETRVWNFVPFLSAGLARSWANGTSNNELAVGAGLLNIIRVSNRVDLTLELRQLVVKQGFDSTPEGGVAGMSSATFGVAVKLGKTGFTRSHTAEYANRISALEAANAALAGEKSNMAKDNENLKAENAALKKEVEALRNKPAEVIEVMPATTPGAVFFEIGKAELSAKELFQLDFYMKNIIANGKDKIFLLTGYADKQTGTAARNQQLSQMRVDYVYNLLIEKYGVPADRLIVKAAGSTEDRWGDPALNRCVVLEIAEK